MTIKEARKLNYQTIPSFFKFKVSRRHLLSTDSDYIYNAERIKETLYLVDWRDENGVYNSKLYNVGDVLDYIIDCSWIIQN